MNSAEESATQHSMSPDDRSVRSLHEQRVAARCSYPASLDKLTPSEIAYLNTEHALCDLPELGQDRDKTYRLGIMGGTFDPIHHGHLVAAETAYDELNLDLVLFMPCGSPAFKQNRHVATAEDRYAMAILATADNPHFLVSRFEINRAGITYTADTMRLLRAYYPDNVEFFFITGADAIANIIYWHNAHKISSSCHFVAATRPGYDLRSVQRRIEASNLHLNIRYLEVPALSISSSYLRERVQHQRSLRYLTPDTVTGYIHKHLLYGADIRVYKHMDSDKDL